MLIGGPDPPGPPLGAGSAKVLLFVQDGLGGHGPPGYAFDHTWYTGADQESFRGRDAILN